MGAYFVLLGFIYIVYFITRVNSTSLENSNHRFLILSFIAIYLLCVLRDYSVGRDILGYINTYENAGYYQFLDTTWTHMEIGYVALMQICSMLGLSSRMFLFIVYAIILFPIYFAIKEYSVNPLLSVIIFICFQFLTFDLSGIRQGMAVSVCMMSLPYVHCKKIKDIFLFTLVILIACLLHKSSIIFFIVPLMVRLKYCARNIIIAIIAILSAPNLTGFLMRFNEASNLSKYEFDDRLTLGGMLVFISFILGFVIISYYKNKEQSVYDETKFTMPQYIFLLTIGLFFTLAFNGTMLGRSTMCYYFFIALAIPRAIQQYSYPNKLFLQIGFHIIMLLFFYMFCLLPKTMDTVPYVFGNDLLF